MRMAEESAAQVYTRFRLRSLEQMCRLDLYLECNALYYYYLCINYPGFRTDRDSI
jgi:hypothetical protein